MSEKLTYDQLYDRYELQKRILNNILQYLMKITYISDYGMYCTFERLLSELMDMDT